MTTLRFLIKTGLTTLFDDFDDDFDDFDDDDDRFSLLRRKKLGQAQYHSRSGRFVRYFWYERFGLIAIAEAVRSNAGKRLWKGGRRDDDGQMMMMMRSSSRGGEKTHRNRSDERPTTAALVENTAVWYGGRGGRGRGRGRRTGGEIPRPRERGREKDTRHASSFRRETRGGGFQTSTREAARGDGSAWSMVPLLSTCSSSSSAHSSSYSSSQHSLYGRGTILLYNSPCLSFEGFELSPPFRFGGRQRATKRRLRRLEERVALGINVDENGVPFDRELTKNQKERLVEFKAFKKELEQEDPFLESAEVLGLFLEYEDERNVPLLGHEVETSSSSSSSSSSGSADTTCTSTTTVIESSSNNSGSDGTGDRDENTSSTDDDNESDEEEDKREDYPHQNDNNNNNENEQRGDSYFDLETFVKDVSECLHVNDSIDDETEYKDGNSKGTSSGVSSLDVSHEQL